MEARLCAVDFRKTKISPVFLICSGGRVRRRTDTSRGESAAGPRKTGVLASANCSRCRWQRFCTVAAVLCRNTVVGNRGYNYLARCPAKKATVESPDEREVTPPRRS